MKSLSLIFITICLAYHCHSQNIYFKGKPADFDRLIDTVKEKYIHTLYRHSIMTVAFVKFDVDSLGHVDSVKCNFGTPSYISDYLKEAFQSTDGNWLPVRVEGKALVKTTFLQPVIITLQTGKEDIEKSPDKYLIAMYSVANMLYFGDNASSDKPHFGYSPITLPLNCVILNPMYLSTVQ